MKSIKWQQYLIVAVIVLVTIWLTQLVDDRELDLKVVHLYSIFDYQIVCLLFISVVACYVTLDWYKLKGQASKVSLITFLIVSITVSLVTFMLPVGAFMGTLIAFPLHQSLVWRKSQKILQ